MNNTNYRRFEINNGNPAAMALEDYYDKLDKLHERVERRRLDGVKPTRSQIKARVRRTRNIIPMQSVRVIDEITAGTGADFQQTATNHIPEITYRRGQ